MKLRRGDTVKVVRGKDGGKTGKIDKIFPKLDKVLVEGMNQVKRHVKAKMPGDKSEIITLTKPLPVANVVLICPNCKKPTRIGFKVVKTDKTRVCKKCNKEFV